MEDIVCSLIRLLFIICAAIPTVLADRTSEKIYINLNGNLPCFRRFNATHQIGCASQRGGSVGVLQYGDSYEELLEILNYRKNYPFIIVLKPDYFIRFWLMKMKKSGKVNGVLLLYPDNESFVDKNFSPDQVCPNYGYGLYRDNWKHLSCPFSWNLGGNGFLFEDWGFPIFLMRDKKDNTAIKDCFDKFNSPASKKFNKWPFCAAELKANMIGAKDSKTCLRRSRLVTNLRQVTYCDPLGDSNIWSTLKPMNKSTPPPKNSVIVLAAKMDATTQFDSLSPGAHSTVTGLITLLVIAEALKSYVNEFPDDVNVMYILFNGESWDYIGSSRMVYDMQRNMFPLPLVDDSVTQPALINLDHIAHFIELNQLSQLEENEAIYMHFDPISNEISSIFGNNSKLKEVLLNQAKIYKLNLAAISKSQPLPPSSIQSFLRAGNISGVVLADHERNYTNKFYNSIFDDGEHLNVSFKSPNSQATKIGLEEQLTRVASVVAGAIYQLATGKSSKIEVKSKLISELLYCYLNKSNCQLFWESSDPIQALKLSDHAFPLYVSVDTVMNDVTKKTLDVLAYLTGDVMKNLNKKECHTPSNDQIFRYIWMQTGNSTDPVCIRTTANFSIAVSPAFDIDGYDFDSGLYSTWTESIWESTSVRIFLKPSIEWESAVMVIGVLVFIISFVVVWFINYKSDVLFMHSQVDC